MASPSNYRQQQPNNFLSKTFALAAIVRQHHAQNHAIIPLIGGDDPNTGKRPALSTWKPYQTRLATPTEIDTWLAEGLSAYGVVCGQISGLIVLDIDDSDVAVSITRRFPRLMKTHTVRSGLRGTPHIYWRVDFPVKSQSVLGGDLKAEGSYVVGAGSEIAGRVWQVENDAPIRPITQSELERILTVLRPAPQFLVEGNLSDESIKTKPLPYHANEGRGISFSTSTIIPNPAPPFTYAEAIAIYRAKLAESRQRNTSLFNTACYLRNLGCSKTWTMDALAKIHANEPPHLNQKQESFTRRLREAIGTINSAYSRPPRPTQPVFIENDTQPVSRLSGSIREKLLARPERDGTAILRTLEGLYLLGQQAGSIISLPQACQFLKGRVGRSSILKAFSATVDVENSLFDAVSDTSVRFCPSNKEAVFCYGASAFHDARPSLGQSAIAGGSRGKHRPATYYRLPSPQELCQKLGVELSAGDPITLDDIVSAKTYRAALEREFIKRRPGCYAQSMLANRLNVSKRTLRRYHQHTPIQSRACYLDQHILWFNLDHVPLRAEAVELGLGGYFLMDQMGKRYPAYREIARKLLGRGQKLLLRQQTFNFYWYGNHEPVAAEAKLMSDGYERHMPAMSVYAPTYLSCPNEEKSDNKPSPNILRHPILLPSNIMDQSASQDNVSLIQSNVIYVKAYTLPQAPVKQKRPRRRRKRKFHYPLEDAYAEKIANRVHDAISALSLRNARRLVDAYGARIAQKALSRVTWLDERERATNPAGLLIVVTGVLWRVEHGWGVPKPIFKAEPKRRPRPKPRKKSAMPLEA